MDNISHQFQLYKKWVYKNHNKVAELEAFVKWGSYILAGRFGNSAVLCEIVYAGSRLFELLNDFIICRKLPYITSAEFSRLNVLLTVLEYVEVLIEVSASQLWGDRGKWAVITIIQLTKFIWRLLLLFRRKMKMITSPPIRLIERQKANERCFDGFEMEARNGVVRLPRSGRLIRTLDGTPPPHLRTFSPPDPDEFEMKVPSSQPRKIPQINLIAEVLHVFRPIGHLSSVCLFGERSWMPWCLAFGIDLTSIQLHSQSVLTKEEKRELVYRRLSLLYYLIRTPAFQTVTHRRIRQFLIAAGKNIPMARLISQPLLDYIPEWQKIYSYTWS